MSKATYPANASASQEDGELGAYLRDLTKLHRETTPLSREREYILYERIQEGDVEARNELVIANLRFTIDIAKDYQNRGLTLSELISAGNLGLLTAAERFDGTRGYKFISYAVHWIRQGILQALAEQTRTVRIPINKTTLATRIKKAARNLEEPLNLEEMAERLDISEEELKDTILANQRILSLDEALEDNDERNLYNFLSANQPAPEDEIALQSSIKELNEKLSRLDNRQYQILRMYYGLDGNKPLTLERIGHYIGLTRERVRQLKEKALKDLRKL